MRSNNSNGSRAAWARGFAALLAMLVPAAAGGRASAAPTETVLHSFTGGDGANPAAGLIADSSGNLYGTTEQGGATGYNGVVFKLSPGGTYTVLYSFTGGSDGELPAAGLIADSSGNLYSTTEIGGGGECAFGRGFLTCGVVFKLSPGGTETVLHDFTGQPSDGFNPVGGLVADSSGNLYGTTVFGGGSNEGVVFKLSPSGSETVLHSFTDFGGDGGEPRAGLIADSSGNLYGTTRIGGGGNGNGAFGVGVVFKLSPSGTETVLYSFMGFPSDGAFPFGGLIADSSSNLYGTTGGGGASRNGVVFKLSPSGTETVLYSFCSLPNCTDGMGPLAGLIADSSGNLYGTTQGGGASGCGVVFKLTPGGTETVLYSFTGGSDGSGPIVGLIADRSGNLFGTTEFGGASACGDGLGCGTVFKLTGTGFTPPPRRLCGFRLCNH